ncbi:ABC transporter permease protein [Octadecabacter arcticus 238]|jgi:putative hydroxymethylpyrimidine transport system permease protein|uniref:ABC transporter permease protein n=1 Tax=Octadecabacter arcticus 238 TaxID=391616 RepID=M9RGH5_9RHOB|nr:ABC transporter permease [Octadecabacter arcticus]AGI71724.1 ABC transporter permease protein [Octadecabacter arcticus 238]
MTRIRYALGACAFALLLWQGIVWLTGVPSFILPSPLRVAQAALDNRVLIAENALVTATEVILGLITGTVLGAFTAVQLANSDRLHRLVMPLLIFTQAVPVFALAPILTLWFGYGIASKVVMAVLIIYFPVTSAFYDGLTRVPADILDMAKTMGGTKRQIMRRIKIPHALPSLGTGLKLAAVYAPIGAVIGEWVGASKGLGYLMLLANGRAKTDLMFASLFTLVAMTLLLSLAVTKASDHLSKP